MKNLLPTFLLLCFALYSGESDSASITTVPNQPTAGSSFTAQYQWTINGSSHTYAVHEDGNEHTVVVEDGEVKIYLNILSSTSWSPWIPTEASQDFSIEGLSAGDYTIELIGFSQIDRDVITRVPSPGDSQFVYAQGQFGVGVGVQSVNLWSDFAVLILCFFMLLIGYQALRTRAIKFTDE